MGFRGLIRVWGFRGAADWRSGSGVRVWFGVWGLGFRV